MIYSFIRRCAVFVYIYINLWSGASSSRFTREAENNTVCNQLDRPGWKIDSLRSVTLDAWPWNCLESRFANDSLDTLVSQSGLHLQEITHKGYIGFLQYYLEKKGVTFSNDHKANALYVAAKGGQLAIVKYFVENKDFPVDVNDTTLLLSAAFGGNVHLLKYLIDERNLTKGGISADGTTALHAAALGGHLEAVRFFVETLNYRVNIKNLIGETPAHSAAAVSCPVLEYLIEEKDAELSARDDFRSTLLHYAAYYGQLDVVKYLVERKRFDVEVRDVYELTPLHKATRNGKFEVVKYLAGERKANTNGTDIYCMNILHQAVIGDNLQVMKFLVDDMKLVALIEECNFFNRTVAMEAAKYGTLSILKYLVDEKHANIYSLDDEGCTLLHIAAKENRLPAVKYLIEEKGYQVTLETAYGETAYDLAVRARNADYNSLLEYLEQKINEYNHV